ncbi:helicase-associated domain-containing protein [Microbacterium esteraromaticum]|uniref:Helicase-associated domain-containing protein n=1 Tax=Microbacterium esteraromaticum TaxID=57043 RepID=A0A939IU14_9MICO|nr:helicase-associated domain-containing protein [Microbacterium esteraromaticum]MBN8206812.1 helicase-associated domain-containing protein [Microbacterium esteraromaticum]MBN8416967.1 helicase-associated domain-containing protein [Microbacterium esteraromaticum]
MSTHARPLADRLAAASDAQLERLLRIRGVRPDVAWEDFFDAAEALLESASIDRGLEALTLPEAQTVHAAVTGSSDATAPAALDDLALLDADGRAPAPVAAAVTARGPVPHPAQTTVERASDAVAARAAERAFTTIGAVADLLLATRSAPLSLVATGALSASERRQFAGAGNVEDLRTLAEMAGLVRPVDRELRITAGAEEWLTASFGPRWAQVADAFRAALPRGIRSANGWLPAAHWPQAHPWDPAWPARAAQLQRLAEHLGLLAEDGTEPEWAEPLRTGAAVDTSALEALLPTEVDRLFLQNDLTAIAPGPLVPALDNRLRAMTEHESAAQASSYRFTADALARALAEGETEQRILEFLREVSLTGVPQPLEYLLAQTAARHGLVRVGPDATGGTVVSSADDHLLEAIEIDRNLRPMGLVRDGDVLVSRVGAQTVTWALTDARYPATLVDRDGIPVAASRTRLAPAEGPHEPSYAPLIARLRARQGPDADAAWLDRELDAAVRARALVVVEVAMPDGSSRELTLEASGLGGGRLRGRDRAADVERTLPVRSIRSVRMLES